MYVFIDESWDSGFKFEKNSSKFFTVGLVVFNDEEDYLACEQRIELLKRELWYKDSHEFHFVDSSFKVREAFFRAVSPYNFFYYTIVLNKQLLYGEWFKNKQSFYKYTTSLVFENAKDKLENAKIIIDGSWDKAFRQSLAKYLRQKMNTESIKRIHSVKMLDSKKIWCIQLADYIASATNRKYTKKDDKDTSISIISHRKIYEQFWPKD